ncbi:universal stress protein [Rhodococcus sp. PAMC28707]|uniref:universal stress protein n=1 Tax=unclassified Rhodococcus (in: high G+C Gram-positive bacteria) TaxID=192944 RepID=UPI00109E1B62|nr:MULTISPECIES: universal stress protein [unclassified Rhodococcus (in: high G+C Gram-positive bacteria)]QCB51272.1 universal stress protein [Rhodococcus sp. PAMC28705]QCB60560.1 universal stress protein [Rhodococcus sp. PAMC28707]
MSDSTDNQPTAGNRRHRIDGHPARTAATAELVVGWDGRPPSTSAVEYAVDLAERITAHLHVVHIVDIDDLPIDPDSSDYETELRATLDEQARHARELLDGLDASWTYHAWHGSPADLLDTVADEYQALMVIIGSPRGGFMSFLDSIGGMSVSHRLISRHRHPLLLVPQSGTSIRNPHTST